MIGYSAESLQNERIQNLKKSWSHKKLFYISIFNLEKSVFENVANLDHLETLVEQR